MKLQQKTALITGASRGLGREIARYFVQAGASVMLCARNVGLLAETAAELTQLAQPGVQVYTCAADIAIPSQVTDLITKTLAVLGSVDILVANAGIHGAKGKVDEASWEEWSEAIDVNLKGNVLLTRGVLPGMKQKGHGKIIFLSGGGATKPMPGMSAYAASKAALVRFAETLAEEVRGAGIDVNSVAPGAMNTRLLEDALAAGPEKLGETYYHQLLRQQAEGGTPLEKGAKLCVFLASAESDGISGRLISAVWDPWQQFPAYLNDIRHSDIYTLRRIVPADRGKAWGDVK